MLVCFFLIINFLFFAESSIITKIGHEPVAKNLGMCECGAFPSKVVQPHEQPLLKNNPLNVTCPADDTCKTMCIALAQAAKAKGPTILCAALGTYEDLKVSVFTRTCGNENWEYTGLSCPETICCHDKAPVPCKNELADPIKEELPTL